MTEWFILIVVVMFVVVAVVDDDDDDDDEYDDGRQSTSGNHSPSIQHSFGNVVQMMTQCITYSTVNIITP